MTPASMLLRPRVIAVSMRSASPAGGAGRHKAVDMVHDVFGELRQRNPRVHLDVTPGAVWHGWMFGRRGILQEGHAAAVLDGPEARRAVWSAPLRKCRSGGATWTWPTSKAAPSCATETFSGVAACRTRSSRL